MGYTDITDISATEEWFAGLVRMVSDLYIEVRRAARNPALDDRLTTEQVRTAVLELTDLGSRLWGDLMRTDGPHGLGVLHRDVGSSYRSGDSLWRVAVTDILTRSEVYALEDEESLRRIERVSVSRLLGYPHDLPGILVEMYTCAVEVLAALDERRDLLRRGYVELFNTCASIAGILYSVFCEDEVYAKAHVASSILQGIITDDECWKSPLACYGHGSFSRALSLSLDELVKLDKSRGGKPWTAAATAEKMQALEQLLGGEEPACSGGEGTEGAGRGDGLRG